MTRNRGNSERNTEGGERKDKLQLGNHEENDVVSQLGTQTEKIQNQLLSRPENEAVEASREGKVTGLIPTSGRSYETILASLF